MPAEVKYAFFCEDIRQEVAGKITAVGLWGERCTFLSSPPGTLRNLAFHAHILNPESTALRLQLRVHAERAPLDQTVVADVPQGSQQTNLNFITGGVRFEEPDTVVAELTMGNAAPQTYVLEVGFPEDDA